MKTLKLISLLFAMLIINSCAKKDKDEIEIPPAVFLNNPSLHPDGGGPFCAQELLLRFQDASGNDLVKGIDFWGEVHADYPLGIYQEQGNEKHAWGYVKREVYTLEYIYEDVYVEKDIIKELEDGPWFFGVRPIGLRKGKPFSKKYPNLNGKYDYLYFLTDGKGSPGKEYPFREKVTLRLTCHYIFGNDVAHDIVTWWKPGEDTYINNDKIPGIWSPICYRIEFGGKEITEITYIHDVLYLSPSDSYYGKRNGPYSIATIVLNNR